MISILLVDDEPLILQGLQALIDWESLGCEIIGMANSGTEAIKKYCETPCDIAITDIRMNNMDGLSLIKEWKENHQPKTRWIVLSGYEDFDYVKQGLELGIENYLVKPVNKQELIMTVEQVKDKLRVTYQESVNKYILRDNAIWLYLNGQIDQSDFENRMEVSDTQITAPFTQFMLLGISNYQDVLKKDYRKIQREIQEVFKTDHVICSITPENDFLILFQNTTIEEESKKSIFKLLEAHVENPFILFESEYCHDMKALQTSLANAKACRDHYTFFEEKRMIQEREYKSKQQKQSTQQKIEKLPIEPLLKAIQRNEVEKVKQQIDEILYTSKKNVHVVRSHALELIISINTVTSSLDQSTQSEIIEEVIESETLTELKSILNSVIDMMMKHKDEKHQNNHHIVVGEILNYLEDGGYRDEISLQILGHKYFINPIYLGQLFQKELGMPFSEYLNQMRIQKAKDLLLNTYDKAGEIGKKVGYSDPTYFYRQFKKYTAMTPNEFRNIVHNR